MGMVLIALVCMAVSALVGYTVGRQRNVVELDEARSSASARLQTIIQLRDRIGSLQQENDYYVTRTRRLEEQLVARAHLDTFAPPIPPRHMAKAGIDPSVLSKINQKENDT